MPQYPAVFQLARVDGETGFKITGDEAGARTGHAVSSAGDFNGDGFDDLIIGAFSASPHGTASGAAYIVFGHAPGFTAESGLGALDGTNGFKISGAADYDNFGFAVSSAGDFNGDGFADLVVGAYRADPNGAASGASYVVFGGALGFDANLDVADLDGTNGFKINGETAGDSCGFSVASAGDLNGDGLDDLIVGADHADPNGEASGAAYVVFGTATPPGATVELSELDGTDGFQICGQATLDRLGRSVSSAGDVNRDGFDDLIIGTGSNGTPTTPGAFYVVFGKAAAFGATWQITDLDGANGFKVKGDLAGDHCGWSVAAAGDVNGDGFADVVATALGADPHGVYSGSSYVVFGKATGFAASFSVTRLNGANGFKINGEKAYDYSGACVSSAGDFDGDGFADLLIGARGADPHGARSGAAYVVFGKASQFSATLELSILDGQNGFQISGSAAEYDTGRSVSAAGDTNGDGFADLLLGAPYAHPDGDYSGASYVVFGRMPTGAVTRLGTPMANTIHGGQANDALSGIAGNDTLIGHDGRDLIKGGPGDDILVGGAGNDTFFGGTENETFVYGGASDSTGPAFDIVKDCNFVGALFDIPEEVAGIEADIVTGRLRKVHFDADLALAVNGANLNAHHAVLFTPNSGGLAGKTFLVVDTNGVAGYQAGEDIVIEVTGALNMDGIGSEDFI